MTEQDDFLAVLAEDEDDTPTRLVYSDWLDEHGQHEEADRQRKWPAAKQWLVDFCAENNRYGDDDGDGDDDDWIYRIDYATLLELGREAVQDEHFLFSCGNNQTMCDALRNARLEFWRNWSIVTGIPVAAAQVEAAWFSCAC